tara:strand:+ start:2604 stop:3698 length:1095 start_codon:yes stop_codon:yes gene_type:complete
MISLLPANSLFGKKMTENKKAKLENSIAKVDKSKPDKKEYSNKSSSSQGVSDPYKAIIKNAIIPIFFGAIVGAAVSFLLSINIVPRLPLWSELKEAQEKSAVNFDQLSKQMGELKIMITKINSNIPEEVDIQPIINELGELSKKVQIIEEYDFSPSDVSIKKIEVLIDDKIKMLEEDIYLLGTKIEKNVPINMPSNDEKAKVSLTEALASMQNAITTGLPFQKTLTDYEIASGREAPAIIRIRARTGVPTQFDLLQSFPENARKLLQIDHDNHFTDEESGLGIAKFLKKFVKTRSTSPKVGNSNDAILSRAEYSLKNGDIEKALKELDQLPLDLQNEMRDWYKGAKNHLDANNAMNKLIYFHTD